MTNSILIEMLGFKLEGSGDLAISLIGILTMVVVVTWARR